MIETYLLQHLAAFKQHKTLSEAAEALYLTQPTLTRSMNKLEASFGVPLFIREKKRLSLNENGKLAAEYAENILQMQEQMLSNVKALDRLSRMITVGSCAPGPLMELMPLLTSHFPQMTVSSEIKNEEELIRGLSDHTYQMIILNHTLENAPCYAQKCGSEHLCASLIADHPLANQETIRFADMDGETFLMVEEVGIWETIVRSRMPGSRFLLQDSMESLLEVVSNSTLPSFATDLTIRVVGPRGTRITVPFSDPEAYTDYYCVCLASEASKYRGWYKSLARRMDGQ